MSHIGLHFVTVCLFITIGWCYRSSGNYYGQQREYTTHSITLCCPSNKIFLIHTVDMSFGPTNYGNQNSGNCPILRPFPPKAEKVTDNLPYECLPSYVRNRNAVLDDDDGTTVWAEGRKPDYSSVDALFLNGK